MRKNLFVTLTVLIGVAISLSVLATIACEPLGPSVETFKQKAAEANARTVNIAAIQGLAVPTNGGIPVTAITDNEQYSGIVTWNSEPAVFAAAMQYTATVTLRAKYCYTLQGVKADFFTIEGATSASNAANSGVVTVVFPATAANDSAAADYNISGLTQTYDGSPKAVTVTSKTGKSNGAITVKYNDSTTPPTDAGSYIVTFDVAAVHGWNAASGLPAGTLLIENATPTAADFDISGTGTYIYDGSARSVAITPKAGKSTGTITVKYNGNISVPQAAGAYTVTFDVAAKPNWNATNGLPAGNISIGNATPTADDFDISGLGTFIYDGSVKTVTVTPKAGKSSGAITVMYNGSTTTRSAVGSYTVTFNVAANLPNWNAASGLSAGTITINAKSVTITGLGAANKVYNGNATATVTGTAAVNGRVGSDSVTVSSGTAAFADKNIGTDKTVTFSGYSLSGTAAGNYSLSAQPASVTANITAKELTITGVTATNRAYDGTVTVALSGGTLAGIVSGDAVSFTLGNGTLADANAGNAKAISTAITLTGTDAGNYTLTQPSNITVNVTKATGATVSAPTLNTKTYNSITINPVSTPSNGQIVEYVINTANTAPSTGWQTGTTFSGLNEGTSYYIFARATGNGNYETGTASSSLAVTTLQTVLIEYYWIDQHGSLITTSGGATIIAIGEILAITAQGAGYVVKQWHLDGINTGQSGDTYNFSSSTFGDHTVGLFVEKDGKLYNTNIIITVGVRITFNINGGTGTAPGSQAVSFGSSIVLPYGSRFFRIDYIFDGWNTGTSGTGTNYSAGSSYTPTDSVTLYAKWNPAIFFSEDFEGTNSFTIVNGSQTNQWYVGTATKFEGTKAAYISNNSGTSNAYSTGSTSVVHMYRNVTFPSSTSPYTLTFYWKAQGEGNSPFYDYLRVFLIETSVSPTAGSQPSGTTLGTYNLGGTGLNDWNNATISIPATNSGTTKRLVFTWVNDSSGGTAPPAAVDNIVLR